MGFYVLCINEDNPQIIINSDFKHYWGSLAKLGDNAHRMNGSEITWLISHGFYVLCINHDNPQIIINIETYLISLLGRRREPKVFDPGDQKRPSLFGDPKLYKLRENVVCMGTTRAYLTFWL